MHSAIFARAGAPSNPSGRQHARKQSVIRSLTPSTRRGFVGFQPKEPEAPLQLARSGGDGGGMGGSGGGGGGGSGDSSSSSGDAAAALAILAAAGRAIESLPADMARALAAGKLNGEILQRFFSLEKHPFLKLFIGLGGLRERLLADDKFMAKLGFEVFIGVVTKLSAEYTRRGDAFHHELDFVLANVVMAILADFMLVYVPAPTVTFTSVQKRIGWWQNTGLAKFLDACPGNAFQRVPPGADAYTLGQRAGAILKKGMTLFTVGFSASLIGVGCTNVILMARELLDPTFQSQNRPQNVAYTSLAYGAYMCHNSNLRYQLVAGVVENRILDVFLANNPALNTTLSFAIRTINTFLGSLMWVDFTRFIGMQKSSYQKELEAAKKAPTAAPASPAQTKKDEKKRK